MMDDSSPIESTITVSSNPTDDIEEVLSTVDELYWKPTDNDDTPVITITVTEEEEPVTDIIVNGVFEEFIVTVLNKDNTVVKNQVSLMALLKCYASPVAYQNTLPSRMETPLLEVPILVTFRQASPSRRPFNRNSR